MAYYGNFSPGGYSTQPSAPMPNVGTPPAPNLAQPQPSPGGGGLSFTPWTNPATGATMGYTGQLAPWMYGVGTPPEGFGATPAPDATIQPSPVPAPETVTPQPAPAPVMPQPTPGMPPPPDATIQPAPSMGFFGMANQAQTATGAGTPLGYGNYGGISQGGGYNAAPQSAWPWQAGMGEMF